jgi:hypothetical protein
MTHEGLQKIMRPMTADERADACAGYPASKYRRRAPAPEVAPVVVLERRPGTLAATPVLNGQIERAAA